MTFIDPALAWRLDEEAGLKLMLALCIGLVFLEVYLGIADLLRGRDE